MKAGRRRCRLICQSTSTMSNKRTTIPTTVPWLSGQPRDRIWAGRQASLAGLGGFRLTAQGCRRRPVWISFGDSAICFQASLGLRGGA